MEREEVFVQRRVSRMIREVTLGRVEKPGSPGESGDGLGDERGDLV